MIYILILTFISGMAKGMADRLQFHFSTFSKNKWNLDPFFWNPRLSWKNKYKNRDVSQGPKFWGSTTAFVFLTDGWHLMQFIMINSLVLAIVLYKPQLHLILDFIILRAVFGAGFKILYR